MKAFFVRICGYGVDKLRPDQGVCPLKHHVGKVWTRLSDLQLRPEVKHSISECGDELAHRLPDRGAGRLQRARRRLQQGGRRQRGDVGGAGGFHGDP